MNINHSKHAEEQGSVFLVAMGMIALFALILSSYLSVVEGQADSVARSQSYNVAIPVAEAGVEEAMSLLNKSYPNIASSVAWTNSLGSDGWGAMTSSNTTTKSNLVFGANYYQVTISNALGGTPTIISAGVVPFIQHAWGAEMTTNTANSSSVVSLVRTLQIQTILSPVFGAALAAKGDITFGGNANVDSFNSMKTNLSVNGQYSPTVVDDKATVATDARVVSSISGGHNVDIRGYVNTGPGGTVIASGSIGDNNWVSNSTSGIEPSRSNDTFNVTFPDVSAPTATFVMTPLSATVSGTNYAMVFEGNQFWGTSNVMYQTSFSLSGQQKVLITGGSVVIYIPPGGSWSSAGQSFIYVAPGSSVSIYCAASSASIAGNGFVGATNAADVAVYGLPTCTSMSYAGNGAFLGTIYAPEAAFTGVGNATFTGALMANSFGFTGNATIHYDESLANVGPSTGYVANNWQEVASPLSYQELPP